MVAALQLDWLGLAACLQGLRTMSLCCLLMIICLGISFFKCLACSVTVTLFFLEVEYSDMV